MASQSQNADSVGNGQLKPTSTWGDYNNIAFVVQQALSKMQTSTLVRIVACTNDGELSPVGFVDVVPLINQIDALGNPTPHVTIHNIPYLRMQGGANAIIIDPQIGDIGICMFASRDINKVKITKAQSNPGSNRQYNFADGMYCGGMLNGTPNQYIQFNSAGIKLHSPVHVHEEAPTVQVDAETSITQNTDQYNLNATTLIALTTETLDITAESGTITTGGTTASFGTDGFNISTQMNAGNGYQVAGTAEEGFYLRGNGTLFVSSALLASDLSGAVGIANGGTGATDQAGAANAILPSQTGHGGEVLTTSGTDVSWQPIPPTGSTTLTGDVTGSGTGTIATTLATVNTDVGSYGTFISVPRITVNGKGLITGVTELPIAFPVISVFGQFGSIANLSGDVTTSGSSATTLATVNTTTGSYGDGTHVATYTVNGKGLVTVSGQVAITFPVTSVFGQTGGIANLSGDVTTSGSSVTTLANVATAGTNTKITYNAKGLVTSGTAATLASSDYANQGTATTVLHGNASGNPTWAAVSLTADVSGILPEANGGTNQSTYAQGDLLYASAANTLSKLAKSTAATRYLSNTGTANAPVWDSVSLQTGVSGILGGTNGGTNNEFMQFSGPATSLKTFTLPNTSATILTDNAAVTIAQGGTNAATANAAFNNLSPLTTKGDVLGFSTVNARLAVGSNGQVLSADSTQATGLAWIARLGVKVGVFTRDMTTASGTQAITGVGFSPKGIVFVAGPSGGGVYGSIGVDDGTTHGTLYNVSASTPGNTQIDSGQSIAALTTGATAYEGKVTSLDSDGFTVTWVRTGAPTGTLTIYYLAIG